jgi:RNA-directed DNA polymerase
MDLERAQEVADNIHRHYTMFRVKKRNGRTRTILAPSDALKNIQYQILKDISKRPTLQPSPYAMAARGRGIYYNALPHIGADVIIKLDIKNFFGSIARYRVRRLFEEAGLEDEELIDLYTSLTTYRAVLPIGAPTSPFIADAICRSMDFQLIERLNAEGDFNAVYTRYVDDITLSSNEKKLNYAIPWCKNLLSEWGFRSNQAKIRILRSSNRQEVTGLTVNERVNIPRDDYKLLRARIDHACRDQLTSIEELQSIRGYLSFYLSINLQKVAPLLERFNDYLQERNDPECLRLLPGSSTTIPSLKA